MSTKNNTLVDLAGKESDVTKAEALNITSRHQINTRTKYVNLSKNAKKTCENNHVRDVSESHELGDVSISCKKTKHHKCVSVGCFLICVCLLYSAPRHKREVGGTLKKKLTDPSVYGFALFHRYSACSAQLGASLHLDSCTSAIRITLQKSVPSRPRLGSTTHSSMSKA